MSEQIERKQIDIINNISNLKSSKNPLNVFFILSDLKELFISIWENLLHSIELNYSQKSKKQYLDILNEYKEAWIFESIYNYYLHNEWISKFKNEIDSYFHESFFTDISFYYFTVSRNDKYKIIFDILEAFHTDNNIKKSFFSFDTYIEKKDYLESISTDFMSLKYDKDIYFIIKFLNHFSQFDFSQIHLYFNNTISSNVKIMKEITLIIFNNKQKYSDLYELMIHTFVLDWKIYDDIIDKLEEHKLFEVISFLKNDLVSWINYDVTIDYESKIDLKNFLEIWKKINIFTMDEKINFLISKEAKILSLWNEKWDLARINFKRQLLEYKYHDIIDLTMGIYSLPQDVFYLFKQEKLSLNLDELSIYNEVKDLILYIEKSYFLNLARPFLLKNISEYFNNSDQKYYIIKFILCVILPTSYSDYKKISKFFYNLESFYKKDFFSFVSRIMQFWWLIILIGILSFIAPFWVLVACALLVMREIVLHILSKWDSKLKMSFNFQIGTFASLLWVIAIILATTIGYKENTQIVYNRFNYIINSITLPASESLKALYWDKNSLKVDLIWSKNIK